MRIKDRVLKADVPRMKRILILPVAIVALAACSSPKEKAYQNPEQRLVADFTAVWTDGRPADDTIVDAGWKICALLDESNGDYDTGLKNATAASIRLLGDPWWSPFLPKYASRELCPKHKSGIEKALDHRSSSS